MDIRDLVQQKLLRGLVRGLNNLRIARAARRVAKSAPERKRQPVAFFKASTGIDDLSWNSGFHLLASWGLRLRGVPVAYFTCNAGMSRCVLGTNRDDVRKLPPCKSCIRQSRTLYTGVPASIDSDAGLQKSGSMAHWFAFDRDAELDRALQHLGMAELARFSWPPNTQDAVAKNGAAQQSPRDPGSMVPTGMGMTLPLGELCLPGLRWILRRHNLQDDDDTRFLLREYILSAWNIAQKFGLFLDQARPQAVVVFNGQFFPEATARRVALQRGLRVITHEVGLQPASAFFTEGEATAYPIYIPDDFELNPQQNARLDAYLEQRFQGRFSMAGVHFWPGIHGLDEHFLARAIGFGQVVAVFTEGEATAYPIYIPDDFELNPQQNARLDAYLEQRFQGRFSMAGVHFWPGIHGLDEHFLARAIGFGQVVAVFTNVIFDTSQPHANTVFPDMFAWLDMVLRAIQSHPETLFVIRAHPDETRTRKESRETVQGWLEQKGTAGLSNVVFIKPTERLSSYELIQRSKFVMVYNSTIGLEATIMGKPVLCGGRARFTQYPTVFFPQSIALQSSALEEFLRAERIEVPTEFKRNARRFIYYQLFRSSLPFADFLTPSVRTTQARLTTFEPDQLVESEAIGVISRGLLHNGDFLRQEEPG